MKNENLNGVKIGLIAALLFLVLFVRVMIKMDVTDKKEIYIYSDENSFYFLLTDDSYVENQHVKISDGERTISDIILHKSSTQFFVGKKELTRYDLENYSSDANMPVRCIITSKYESLLDFLIGNAS